jgi:hypothetical protein
MNSAQRCLLEMRNVSICKENMVDCALLKVIDSEVVLNRESEDEYER